MEPQKNQLLQFCTMLKAARKILCFSPKWPISQNLPTLLERRPHKSLIILPFFSFYSTSKPNLLEQEPNQTVKIDWIPVQKLAQQIVKDIRNLNSNHQSIKQSFTHHIDQGTFNRQTQKELVECLHHLSNYPSLIIDNHHLLSIYKIVCFNMHLKSVESLNSIFRFVLLADSHISQSPIYHQFIKFYLQVPIEQIKVKFQIDFDKLSVFAAIKQFLSRTTQRGFFSRTPSYSRNLNVIDPEDILYRLVIRSQTVDSLMIKKLNYTIFMDIKEFYEQEMKENLYHPKKVQLMKKFSLKFMQVLAKQLPQIHHESIHLRELYMKLYLTLPDRSGPSSFQLAPQAHIASDTLLRLKLNNVIYLYNLAVSHIKRLDHLKLQQIEQNIGIVIQFLQQVENNFKQLPSSQQSVDFSYFATDELLHILFLYSQMNLQKCSTYCQIMQRIITVINSYNFSCYFQLILRLLRQHHLKFMLLPLVDNPNQLSRLNLFQLHQLSLLITSQNAQPFYSALYHSLLATILSTDFPVIGGHQLLLLLEIYSKCTLLQHNNQTNQQIERNSQILRVFIMRYLSDHHQQFKISEFQSILNSLLQLPENAGNNFQDQQGNYPHPIFQELSPYLSKVQLLLSNETKSKLHSKMHKTSKKTQFEPS